MRCRLENELSMFSGIAVDMNQDFGWRRLASHEVLQSRLETRFAAVSGHGGGDWNGKRRRQDEGKEKEGNEIKPVRETKMPEPSLGWLEKAHRMRGTLLPRMDALAKSGALIREGRGRRTRD
jgi:hypothetical protein